jgi:SPX domain protein involved in polyphosphate accumulation
MFLVKPNVAESPSEQSTFIRLEQKFLLPKYLWPQLRDLLNTYSQANYLDSQTSFNLIESVYYDSSLLRIYNDHFSNKISRVKVRTRRYAPNGLWKTKSVFMEVKKKEDGICRKERLKVPVEQVALLSSGVALGLTETLAKKNKRTPIQDLADRINTVNSLFEELNLRPQARVVYHREAFEKDGFRVTVFDKKN